MKAGIILKTKTAIYSKHYLSLCAIFTFAGGVFSAPFKAEKGYSFYALLISAFSGAFLCFLVEKYYKNTKILKVLAVGTAAFSIADITVDFCKFIGDSLLARNSIFLIGAVLGVFVLYTASKGKIPILKFALISAFFTGVLLIFFVFSTADKFQFSNIFPLKKFEIKGFFEVIFVYFIKITLPSLLLPVFKENYLKENKVPNTFWGVFTGYSALFLIVLNSLLIFGDFFTERVLYPYAAAVSTVTFGELFTRLDGFVYVICFCSVTIRIVTCVLVIKKAFLLEGFFYVNHF